MISTLFFVFISLNLSKYKTAKPNRKNMIALKDAVAIRYSIDMFYFLCDIIIFSVHTKPTAPIALEKFESIKINVRHSIIMLYVTSTKIALKEKSSVHNFT